MSRLITPKPPQDGNSTSLFNVASAISSDDVNWDSATGWTLRSQCPAGNLWCCGDTNMDPDDIEPKEDPGLVTPLQFKPFMAYQVAGCNAGTSRSTDNTAEARQSAEDWLTANLEGWVTMGMEVGVCGNLGLVDLIDVTDPGGPGNLSTAIALLMQNRRNAGMFDRPIVSIPDWYAPQLDDNVWIRNVADIALAPGFGVDPGILATTDPGEAWVYITGRIEYSIGQRSVASGEMMRDDLTIRRQNRTFELTETLAVYRFDPCGGFKAKVVPDV